MVFVPPGDGFSSSGGVYLGLLEVRDGGGGWWMIGEVVFRWC